MTRPTARDVATEEAAKYGYTFREIIADDRRKVIAQARHRVVFAIYTRCPHLSLPQIGRALGGRDHTTMLNSLWRVCEQDGIEYSQIRRDHPETYVRPSYFTHPQTAEDYRRVARLQTFGLVHAASVAA